MPIARTPPSRRPRDPAARGPSSCEVSRRRATPEPDRRARRGSGAGFCTRRSARCSPSSYSRRRASASPSDSTIISTRKAASDDEQAQEATTEAHREGIYCDAYGLSGTVKVGTGSVALQREKRFPFETAFKDLREWQDNMRAELRRTLNKPTAARRGTLEGDGRLYLAQVKHLASYKSRICEVDAWTALYGQMRRTHLTAEHVRKARGTWAAGDYTPKTINNRVQTLWHLYHVLDGRRAPPPADGGTPLLVGAW